MQPRSVQETPSGQRGGVSLFRAWIPAVIPPTLFAAWGALWGVQSSLLVPAGIGLTVMSFWVGWHRQEALRFRSWFREKRTRMPPLSHGIWEETFAEGYHWRRHQEIQRQQLNAQVGQLQDALQALPDALLLMDREGRLLWVNPAAVRLLHLRWPEDSGTPLSLWLRMPGVRTFLAGDGPAAITLTLPEGDSRVLEGLRYPLDGAGVLVLFQDVTRLRQLEQVRQDFVANVSHELRSPLTVILGFLENLLDGPLGEDLDAGPQLRLMEAEGQRMQSLVEDLLSLARMESADPDPERCEMVHVSQIIERTRESLAGQIAEKNLLLRLDLDRDLAIFMEPLDLRSIVQNLMENAVKYVPSGRDITVFWGQDGLGLLFRVTDSGEGIAPEHLQRITERFYRVDRGRSRRMGGTGLGLSIVRHAAERYGGQLQIQSDPGQGSRFQVRFPLQLERHPLRSPEAGRPKATRAS